MGFRIATTPTNRWPNRLIPYDIDATVFPVGGTARQQVLLAINGWNTSSVIRLIAASATDANRIRITTSPAGACNSPMGMQGGTQLVSCAPGASAGVIMHEIGHALGLVHEHQRPDRNSMVTVTTANVQPARIGNFPIRTSDCPVGPYDCGSIMHYGNLSFSVDGAKQTVTAIDPAVCANIGQRNALSAGDIAAVRAMYETIDGLKDKVVLNESSDSGPALAFHDNRLSLAWRGSSNDNLNVALSNDDGTTFVGKHTSSETSDDAPALASHKGQLFIAFKGSGNENINVAVVQRTGDGNKVVSLSNKITLSETTDVSPTIVSHNGNLYVAFVGSGNENLNLMVSTDDGASFGGKHVSSETTTDAPTLASCNGQLYLGWKGAGNENFNVAVVNTGPNPASPQIFGTLNKVTFPDTTDLRTALVAQSGLLFVDWKGSGNDNFNLLFPADFNKCTSKFTTSESSSHAPALAATDNRMWVTWKGSGNDQLNVARVDFGSQSADAVSQGVTAMNNDLFNELVQIEATLSDGLRNLSQGISAMLAQQQFTNTALGTEIAQNKTMICELEQISSQTCDLLSEAHTQTGLQRDMARDAAHLLEITRTAHPGAEVEFIRLEKLREQIEECCPPEIEPPLCEHEPCPTPADFDERPPSIDYEAIPEPPPLQDTEGSEDIR